MLRLLALCEAAGPIYPAWRLPIPSWLSVTTLNAATPSQSYPGPSASPPSLNADRVLQLRRSGLTDGF